jgi:hypothetical protein
MLHCKVDVTYSTLDVIREKYKLEHASLPIEPPSRPVKNCCSQIISISRVLASQS